MVARGPLPSPLYSLPPFLPKPPDKGLGRAGTGAWCRLVVIEGMGRAVHTNYHAAPGESPKLAVIKNFLAGRAAGRPALSVIFKYEVPAE